ncbi:MAG: 1,4-alpha-glucan branching protein GlgB [Magnetococcales bacterium]|nr:1,4-alpha-glucan branching protein GlgB [Magnetococcales bacterium]
MTHCNDDGNLHPRQRIDEVVYGHCRDPFGFLGRHRGPDDTWVVRTFQPGALWVDLVQGPNVNLVANMTRIHPDGLFAACISIPEVASTLSFRADFGQGPVTFEDPYQFPPLLGQMDTHLLGEGRHWESYERLGSHVRTVNGVEGTAFAVWAPNAHRVSVVGPFNGWDGRRHPMRFRMNSGIWELFIPGVGHGALYKYEIKAADGSLLPLKADPYARHCESPPGNATIVQAPSNYTWGDGDWLKARRSLDTYYDKPMSIYEVHASSWKRKPEEDCRPLTYHEMAAELVPYVKDCGFTHVEFLPLAEHPFEPSWGYQPIGLFAPNHRFGDPDGLRHLVDAFHQAGIGVIVDWVPGHFPHDGHGLGRFDGSALYEHEDPRRGLHPDWNTLIYNYGRKEIANFLIANALFWIREFHIDGLRVDAVASMLYHDYARKDGEWLPNEYGGKENLEAVAFLRLLNQQVRERGAGAITIAEESTAWGGVSRPVEEGGLGFWFKWNMGWMNDTLKYMKEDPIHRRYHHNKLSFGMLYAFHENFILPLSHDEVVHRKGSLLDQMAGDSWQRFANLRAYYTFMWTYPGKKILFMGNEFAQGQEWNHAQSLDWHLPDHYPQHRDMLRLVRDLNHFYGATPALFQKDNDWAGFEWIEPDDAEQSVLSYIRHGKDCPEAVVILNFTPVVRKDFRIGVHQPGLYLEKINSDDPKYGGSGVNNGGAVQADDIPAHGKPRSLLLTLPPLAGMVLVREAPEAVALPPESAPEVVESAAPEVVEQAAPVVVEPVAPAAAAPPTPAPQPPVAKDTLTCLECGREMKSLTAHLKTHGLDAPTYRAKHGLPADSPLQLGTAGRKRSKK